MSAGICQFPPGAAQHRSLHLLLQGLHALDRVDQQGFEQAASDFQQALDLDPLFAAAGQYAFRQLISFLDSSDLCHRPLLSRRLVKLQQHALELDPNLAGAHAHLAEVYRAADRDWEGCRPGSPAGEGSRAKRSRRPFHIRPCRRKNLGRWDDAAKVFKRVRSGKIHSTPALTWCSTSYNWAAVGWRRPKGLIRRS